MTWVSRVFRRQLKPCTVHDAIGQGSHPPPPLFRDHCKAASTLRRDEQGRGSVSTRECHGNVKMNQSKQKKKKAVTRSIRTCRAATTRRAETWPRAPPGADGAAEARTTPTRDDGATDDEAILDLAREDFNIVWFESQTNATNI